MILSSKPAGPGLVVGVILFKYFTIMQCKNDMALPCMKARRGCGWLDTGTGGREGGSSRGHLELWLQSLLPGQPSREGGCWEGAELDLRSYLLNEMLRVPVCHGGGSM